MKKTASLLTASDCDKLTLEQVQNMYRQYVNPALADVFTSFSIGDELIDRAEGVWMFTRSGKKILDTTGGIGVLNTGHNHPRILNARILFQQQNKMEVHKTVFSPYLAALSHNIAQLLPAPLQYSFFCNSGAEAVEGALKMAYKYHEGKRKYVLHSDISFHGKLLGAGAITRSKEVHFKYQGKLDAAAFEFNSIQSVKNLLATIRQQSGESDVYALIVEPFSAGSLQACSNEFLEEIRALCNRENIVLVFDEVFSGWYKTGKLFYFMNSLAVPDVLATSKSLGGGKASVSVYVSAHHILTKAYGDVRNATLHTTTYNGFGEECITALETINTMVDENYEKKCGCIETKTRQRLEQLALRFPNTIHSYRGSGALFGIFFHEKFNALNGLLQLLPGNVFKDDRLLAKIVVAAVAEQLFIRHNIYALFTTNQHVALVFSPALVITEQEVDLFFEALEDVLNQGLSDAVLQFAKRKFSNLL